MSLVHGSILLPCSPDSSFRFQVYGTRRSWHMERFSVIFLRNLETVSNSHQVTSGNVSKVKVPYGLFMRCGIVLRHVTGWLPYLMDKIHIFLPQPKTL